MSNAEEKEKDAELAVEHSTDPPVTSIPKMRWILASIVLVGEVACSVLEAQLTAVGFELPEDSDGRNATNSTNPAPRFRAPHFYAEVRFFGRSLAFPIMFIGMMLFSVVRRKKFSTKQFLGHCSKVAAGSSGITAVSFFKLFALPTLCSMGIGVGYIVALAYVAPSVCSAVFAAVVAMSYVLSIFFLKHPHLIVKTLFVFISFAGVGLVAYETIDADLKLGTLGEHAYVGVIAVLIATTSLAFYQLTFTKSFPDADSFQSAFVVSVIFGICALIYWPVPLALKMLDEEVWQWNQVPWGYLLGGMFSSLGFAFLYAYGLALSTPFFMSVGELLNLAVSGLVDHFVRGVPIGPFQISGFAVVGVAFVVLILPDRILALGQPGKQKETVQLDVNPSSELPVYKS